MSRFSPPKATLRLPGVFQCRAAFAYDQLTVQDFASEQLFLPKNLEKAIHKRQIEHLLGRFCIKQCFQAFGVEPMIVAMGEDRSPMWPEGWVGSISHSKGQVSAVLSRSTDFRGLGIDLEPLIENHGSGMQNQLCSNPEELTTLMAALDLDEQATLTLIFSAKESLYKLIFPRHRRYFGFQAATITYGTELGLVATLNETLNAEFPAGRSWAVAWQRLDAGTIETFIAEKA